MDGFLLLPLSEDGDQTGKFFPTNVFPLHLANNVNKPCHEFWQTRKNESEIKRRTNFIIKWFPQQMGF